MFVFFIFDTISLFFDKTAVILIVQLFFLNLIVRIDYGGLYELSPVQLHTANCRTSGIPHVLPREMRIVFTGNVQQNWGRPNGVGTIVDGTK